VRKVRIYAEASVEVLAAALNLTQDILKQLESNETVPWILPASAMAEVAEVFRLHMNAVEALTKNSHTVARRSGALPDPNAARQVMSSWLKEVRSELQRRGANDLVE
jgi:ribosome-binding protein aMBF1 (putative translation factor)